MKKLIFIILSLFILINNVYAEEYCTESSVEQVAKIIYKEVGGRINSDPDEDFFAKLLAAGILLNNASDMSGVTFADKLYNLNDDIYQHYSSYKYSSFETVVPVSEQSKMLYIAEMVLTGQFNVPKGLNLQASKRVVERWGTVWTEVPVDTGNGIDVYYGYSQGLQDTDALGNPVTDKSADYYRQLAASLRKNDYSNYTVSTICMHEKENTQSGNSGSSSQPSSGSGNRTQTPSGGGSSSTPSSGNGSGQGNRQSGSSGSSSSSSSSSSSNTPLCQNPNALRAIYIAKTIIQVAKILVPVIIIITSIISFSKTIMYDEDIKTATGLFLTKVFVGVMVFFIPTIVKATLSLVDTSVKTFNFNECYNNATPEKIRQLEKKK